MTPPPEWIRDSVHRADRVSQRYDRGLTPAAGMEAESPQPARHGGLGEDLQRTARPEERGAAQVSFTTPISVAIMAERNYFNRSNIPFRLIRFL